MDALVAIEPGPAFDMLVLRDGRAVPGMIALHLQQDELYFKHQLASAGFTGLHDLHDGIDVVQSQMRSYSCLRPSSLLLRINQSSL